ncbi:MAG: XrtA system polysaccharide deacetylase [Deferrisomatales bacterium]
MGRPPTPEGPGTASTVNALTIDVEDYFQVSAFEAVCDPSTWPGRECRVEANTHRVLELLAERGVRATFFVLGWVAERFPGLARAVAAAGHEVASHGYGHRRVCTQTREELREDLRRSKGLLEDQAGAAVLGYRAPSYSVGPTCLWAFDELVEAGFAYDSSVFPVRHDLYGIDDWPRFPFWLERLDEGEARTPGRWDAGTRGGGKAGVLEGQGNWVPAEADPSAPVLLASPPLIQPASAVSLPPRGRAGVGALAPVSQPPNGQVRPTLLEIPITTLRLGGRNWPIAGGGYFRLFPYRFTRWGLKRINEREGQPFVFYLHPWELDPDQPRIEGAGLKSRLRHYLNLNRTEGRFRRLLQDFRFAPIRDAIPGTSQPPAFHDPPPPRLPPPSPSPTGGGSGWGRHVPPKGVSP